MRELYGRGMMVYSVHGLLHLTDDVRRYGVLDNFSFSHLSKEHFLGPVPSSVCGARQYAQVKVKGLFRKLIFETAAY
jgi:hypothetical protein